MRLAKAVCFVVLKMVLFLELWVAVGFTAEHAHQAEGPMMFLLGALFILAWDMIDTFFLQNPYFKEAKP